MTRATQVGLVLIVAMAVVAGVLAISRHAGRVGNAASSQAAGAMPSPVGDDRPSASEAYAIALDAIDHPTPEQTKTWAWVDKGRSALDYGTKPIDAPLAERWDELERAAREGDSKAGLQLHFDLEECRFLKSKEARDLLYAPKNPAEGVHPQIAANIDAELDRIERARRNCAGISDEQLAMSKAILRQSAEAGNPYAALLYQDRGRPSEEEATRDTAAWSRYQDDMQRYLQGLAFRCVVEGIQRLASMYQSRAYPAPTSVTAYAYYEWEQLAWTARGFTERDPVREGRMSEGLTDLQRRIAQQRAHALFNRYCL
jgi:hypothetical protein